MSIIYLLNFYTNTVVDLVQYYESIMKGTHIDNTAVLVLTYINYIH